MSKKTAKTSKKTAAHPAGARPVGSRVTVTGGPFTGQLGRVAAVDGDLLPLHYTVALDDGGELDAMPADRLGDAPPLAP